MDHLRLIQRQHTLASTHEDVAVQGPTVALQSIAGVEQVRVVGHIEHPQERQVPEVIIWFVAPENWELLVDTGDNASATWSIEYRACQGVRIKSGDVLGSKRKMS